MANEFVARTGLIIKGITSSNISTTYSLYIDEETGLIAYNTSSIISSGSNGFIPYYTSDGKTIGQASILYWDDSLNRLGIGTASPEYTLDVNGSSIIRGTASIYNLIISTLTGSNSNSILYVNENGLVGITSSSSATNIQSGTAGYLAYYPVNGTTISSASILFWNQVNSRLGIGTASPEYTLDVNGTMSVRRSISLGLTNSLSLWDSPWKVLESTTGALAFGVTATDLHLTSNSYYNIDWRYKSGGNRAANYYLYNGEHIWRISNSIGTTGSIITWIESMKIANTGNVLVNTNTDAGFKLQVAGQIYTNYDSSPFLLTNEVTVNSWATTFISGGKAGGYKGSFIFRAGTNANIVSDTPQLMMLHRTGAIGIGNDITDDILQSAGRASINIFISATPSSKYSLGYYNAYVENITHNSIQNNVILPVLSMGAVNKFVLTSTNNPAMQIGWQYKGLVGGGYDSDIVVSGIDSNRNAVEILRIGSAYSNLMLGLTNSSARIAVHGTDSNPFLIISSGSSSNILRVNNNGNIMIGTTYSDSGYKLDVNGSFRMSGGSYSFYINNFTSSNSALIFSSPERSNVNFPNFILDTPTKLAAAGGPQIDFRMTNISLASIKSNTNPGALAFYLQEGGVGATVSNLVATIAGDTRRLTITSGNLNQADYNGLLLLNNRGSANDYTTLRLQNNVYTNATVAIKQKLLSINTADLEFYVSSTGEYQAMTLKNTGNLLLGTTTDSGFQLQTDGDIEYQSNLGSVAIKIGDTNNQYPTGNLRNVTIGGSNTLSPITSSSFNYVIGHGNGVSFNTSANILIGNFNSQRANYNSNIAIGSSNIIYNGFGTVILGSAISASHSYTVGGGGSINIGTNLENFFNRSAVIGGGVRSTGLGQLVIAQQSLGGTTQDGYNDVVFGTGWERVGNLKIYMNRVTIWGAYGATFSGSAGGALRASAGLGTGTGSTADFYIGIPKSTTGETRHTVEDRIVVKGDSGFMGIGLTAPSYDLHVRGTASVSNFRISNSGATPSSGLTAGLIINNGNNLNYVDIYNDVWKLPKVKTLSYFLDFPSTGSNGQSTITASFTGARVSDVCVMGLPDITAVQGLFNTFVVSEDLIAIRYYNTSGGVYDPDAMTYSVTIMR